MIPTMSARSLDDIISTSEQVKRLELENKELKKSLSEVGNADHTLCHMELNSAVETITALRETLLKRESQVMALEKRINSQIGHIGILSESEDKLGAQVYIWRAIAICALVWSVVMSKYAAGGF